MKEFEKQIVRTFLSSRRDDATRKGAGLVYRTTMFFVRDYRGIEFKARLMYLRIHWKDCPGARDKIHQLIKARL